MLRLQYNFRVRERTEAYEQARFPVMGNYCLIETQAECCPFACSLSKGALYGNPWTAKGKKRTPLAQQDANLVDLKQERPWYQEIYHHVLQQMLKQVDAAFGRFFRGLGKYPKTKRQGKFRSFTYPSGDVTFKGNKVRLPGIGWMSFFQSDCFPMVSAFVPSLCGKKQMAFIFLFCCKMSLFQIFQQQIKLKQQ